MPRTCSMPCNTICGMACNTTCSMACSMPYNTTRKATYNITRNTTRHSHATKHATPLSSRWLWCTRQYVGACRVARGRAQVRPVPARVPLGHVPCAIFKLESPRQRLRLCLWCPCVSVHLYECACKCTHVYVSFTRACMFVHVITERGGNEDARLQTQCSTKLDTPILLSQYPFW